MKNINTFSIKFYLHTLKMILGRPGTFFRNLSCKSGIGLAVRFLIVSCLLSASAIALLHPIPNSLTSLCIYFINAVGMVFISAAIGYITMIMVAGKAATFGHLFNVYAFSTGITMLASWMPYFLFITEPWKWWLIAVGMRNSCKLSLGHTLLIIFLSITIIVLFFISIIPLLNQ